MSEEKRLEVQGVIAATAAEIFGVLADPAQHPRIDGSGMVRGLATGQKISGLGQSFVMDMNQDGIGDYQMHNEVVCFEPERQIGWAPRIHPPGSLDHLLGGADPSGHRFVWELEPTSDGTRVTHSYDWSGVADEKALPLYPRVSAQDMSQTLDRLAAAVR